MVAITKQESSLRQISSRVKRNSHIIGKHQVWRHLTSSTADSSKLRKYCANTNYRKRKETIRSTKICHFKMTYCNWKENLKTKYSIKYTEKKKGKSHTGKLGWNKRVAEWDKNEVR